MQIIKREADAVEDWVRKDKILHSMRDHYWHTHLIMGGMYGIYQKNETMIHTFDKLRTKMIMSGNEDDQDNLKVLTLFE